MEMLLTHIRQLCPIITRNQEVISYIELGFLDLGEKCIQVIYVHKKM